MTRTVLVAVGLLVVLAAPAWAATYQGSVAADAVVVQGATRIVSSHMLTQVGGTDDSFQGTAPNAVLTFNYDALVEHRYSSVDQVRLGSGSPVAQAYDPLAGGTRTTHVPAGAATFDDWTAADAQIVVATRAGASVSELTTTGYANAPVPLRTLDDAAKPIVLGEPAGDLRVPGFTGPEPFVFTPTKGSLVFEGAEFGRTIDIRGDFDLYVFGATLHFQPSGATFQSGERLEGGPTVSVGRAWTNVTYVHVVQGRLTIDPGTNHVVSYADEATLGGRGSVLLRQASGHLASASRSSAVSKQDLSLVGDYALDVRGSSNGFLAAVQGSFADDLVGLSAGNVHGSDNLWWWLAGGVGLVAVGGGLVGVTRRRAPQRLVAPAAAPLAPVEVPDAPHVAPDFGWETLNEEFGVVRAGEKAGVLIVLVPADKAQPFLDAVVRRGLMAEDTGDRIHAGDHELAVIALEPSPVMMN